MTSNYLLSMWRTRRLLEVTGLMKQVPRHHEVGMRVLASAVNVIRQQPYF